MTIIFFDIFGTFKQIDYLCININLLCNEKHVKLCTQKFKRQHLGLKPG